MLNELAYSQGVEDGMAKFAISRFRQHARNLTQAASKSQDPAAMAKAQAVTSQAYKPRVLGTGAEGTATLHMMPQASEGGALTPTVRKVFDPKSELASDELINRRVALGPALNASGDFAKYYGQGKTDAGRRFIDSEYVPGKLAPGADVTKAQANIDRSLRSAGMKQGIGHLAAKDIRPANLGVNPKTGKTVALDYLPMKRDEAYDPRYARMAHNPIEPLDPSKPFPTPKGGKLFPNSQGRFNDPLWDLKVRAKMDKAMARNPQAVLPSKPVTNVMTATSEAPTGAVSPPVPQLPPGQQVAGPSVFGSL